MRSYENAWPVDALLKQYLSNTSTGFKKSVKAVKNAGEDVNDPAFIDSLLDDVSPAHSDDEDQEEDESEREEEPTEETVASSSRQILGPSHGRYVWEYVAWQRNLKSSHRGREHRQTLPSLPSGPVKGTRRAQDPPMESPIPKPRRARCRPIVRSPTPETALSEPRSPEPFPRTPSPFLERPSPMRMSLSPLPDADDGSSERFPSLR